MGEAAPAEQSGHCRPTRWWIRFRWSRSRLVQKSQEVLHTRRCWRVWAWSGGWSPAVAAANHGSITTPSTLHEAAPEARLHQPPPTVRHLTLPPPVISLAIGRSLHPHAGCRSGKGTRCRACPQRPPPQALLPRSSLDGAVIGSGRHQKGAAIKAGCVGWVCIRGTQCTRRMAHALPVRSAPRPLDTPLDQVLATSRLVGPSAMQGLETSLFTRHRHASPTFFFLDKSRFFFSALQDGVWVRLLSFLGGGSFCTFGVWVGMFDHGSVVPV